jgi:hypothetical protein
MKQLTLNFWISGYGYMMHYYLNEFNEYGERNFNRENNKLLVTKKEIRKMIEEDHGIKSSKISCIEVGE